MLKRLIQWFKRLFQSLFGKKQAPSAVRGNVQNTPPPPLNDTDLEFLFNELLEGVHQARGQQWALKWLHNLEHRVPQERWVEWLQRFGERLLASPTPNNELASRMVQLGDLDIGQVGNVAYDIGMQMLTRNDPEPVWEYNGPDAQGTTFAPTKNPLIQAQENNLENFQPNVAANDGGGAENLPQGGELQTITLEELFTLMEQDENIRQMIAQQLGIQTDDPQIIIQALIEQFHADNQSRTDQT